MAAARENLPPQVIQRVARELRRLVMAPPDGIRYVPQEDEQLSEIHVEIRGPENTPYEGGFFRLKLVLSDGFPQAPPKGFFLTKIFHPNIATSGDICVNTLKKDWSPTLGIAHVLQVIRCLLIVPFPESSLNDEAGRLFMESYEEYARRARIWTNIHAPKQSASAKADEQRGGESQGGGSSDAPADGDAVGESAKKATGEEDAPTDAPTAADSDATADAAKSGCATATPVKAAKDARAGSADAPEPQSISAPSSAKKRTSSNAADIAASLKKKSAKKKGIKRL